MKTPCNENRESCPYQYSGCFEDTHHLMWPKRDYKTPVERRYRELPENKVQLCRDLHDLEHYQEPPEKPSREEMLGALSIREGVE